MAAAEASFARSAKLRPGDPKSRTALALTHMAKGQVDTAFGELEAIASADPGTSADLALISAQLKRRRFEAALKAIDRLERKQADKPAAPYLRGIAQIGLKQHEAARKSFEQALRKDPAYFAAASQLAKLDLQEKKPDAARNRFEQVLKARPGSADAMLALAGLKAASGGSRDEVGALVAEAVKLDPSAAGPRLTMIGHHMAGNKPEQAVAAAQEAVAQSPNNPQLLDALGRAQLAAGDTQQAIATFNKVSALLPESPAPLLRLADVHMAAKNNEAAAQHLKRALTLKPDLLEAQDRLSLLHRSTGRFDDALAVAKTVQKQRPKQAAGLILEGDVEAARKNWSAAAAAYRGSLNLEGGAMAAIRLHVALLQAGKRDEAAGFSLGWIKDHPKDAGFLLYLGESSLVRGDDAAAEGYYAKVLEIQPSNVTALNNIAWLLNKHKKPGALAYAEKANELRPNQPILLDTLAQVLAQQGNIDRALDLRRKAVELAPANGFLRLSLAKLYVDAGKKADAKSELQRLAASGDKFPKQSEVQELLKAL